MTDSSTPEDPIIPLQVAVNRAQSGVNRLQGELNITQAEINDAQGELNDTVVVTDEEDAAILAAIDTFQAETSRLRYIISQENASRAARDKFVSHLFVAVTVAIASIVLIGGLVWNQQQQLNRRQRDANASQVAATKARCVSSRDTRASLKGNLIGLVTFALAASPPETPAAQHTRDEFVAEYKVKLEHDLPDLHC